MTIFVSLLVKSAPAACPAGQRTSATIAATRRRRTAASLSRRYDRQRMDSRPVGVFGSGVGGLTVLHECLVTLPHEDFLYLGDHARLPYGPRPLAEVRRFAPQVGAFLPDPGVERVVD